MIHRIRSLFWLLAIALFCCGCDPTVTQNLVGKPGEPAADSTDAKPDGQAQGVATEAGEFTSQTQPASEEYWDSILIRGVKVGHVQTVIEPITRDGRTLMKSKQETSLSVKRFGTPLVNQTTTFESVETLDGQVVEFLSRAKMGRAPTETRGTVDGKEMSTEVTTQGKTIFGSMPWKSEYGSFFAAEQSLKKKPLKPGEKRTFQALMPMATAIAIADVTLTAEDWEQINIRGTELKLLKFQVSMAIQGAPANQALKFDGWLDDQGVVRRQLVPGLGMEYYRTTKADALGLPEDKTVDLALDTTVRVRHDFINPHNTKRVVYRVKLTDADPQKTFPTSEGQQVQSEGNRTAQVTVTAIRDKTPADLPVKSKAPVEADSSPNSLIQSDDQRILQMAASVLPKETDNWKLAVALEKYTHDAIRKKNFSTTFATAAEVAQTREGDCTEHAVLLAALCRAREIPARVAIGLIYFRPIHGFAYHMWTEVWTGERWVPLDATLGQGGIGAAHLKLADSHLEGATGLGTFMPVANVLGKLELEVVKVE